MNRGIWASPRTLKVDLWAKETSESVRVAAVLRFGGGGGGVGGENDDDDTRYATMLTVVAYGIRAPLRWKPKGTRRGRVSRTTFAECSARAFGDEKPPFTTRDANIRKAQKGNLASQSPHHHPKTTTRK